MKVGTRDVMWGYLSTFLYVGVNILLLPFVLKALPPAELGLWYTFTSIGTLAMLLDFGFTNIMTRNIAYAWSGAHTILEDGIDCSQPLGEPNIPLFCRVFRVSRTLYVCVSLLVLLSAASLGTWYIVKVVNGTIMVQDYMGAWIIYVLALSLNIYYSFWTPVLKGVGAVKEDYQSMVASKVLQLIVTIVMILFGYRLAAVSVGYLVGNVGRRAIAMFLFNRSEATRGYLEAIKKCKVNLQEQKQLFGRLWPSTYKQGCMSLAGFLTSNFTTLICSYVFGLELSSQYGLTMQLIGIVVTVASVMYNSYLPMFNYYRITSGRENAYRLFTMCNGMQILLIAGGGAAALLVGEFLLKLIGSQSHLLPLFPGFVILAYLMIKYHEQLCVSYIMTENNLSMYKPYIIMSGIMIAVQIVSAWFFRSWGLWCLIIPQLLVELSYNAWKWPLFVINDFGVSPPRFYMDSLKNVRQRFRSKSIEALS